MQINKNQEGNKLTLAPIGRVDTITAPELEAAIVLDGVGALACGDFVKGKHEPAIWVYRKGVSPVPGALTFE